jgi:RNA polymerase sigma-70 factor (ECF subfamily)
VTVALTPELDSASQLMAGVAAKEPKAQEALIRRVHGRVRRLSRCLCASDADADDVAQQAILELLRSAGAFRFETSLERWVDRITVRCALSAIRREKRRQSLLARWLMPGRLPWGAETQWTMSDPARLDAILSRLPYERREAIILRHGLGYAIDEIAELTDTPRGTVKDRLVCGKKQLRRWLKKELSERDLGGRDD